jgi:type IV pilus assembly protein PilM
MASAQGGAGPNLFARLKSGLNFSFKSGGGACIGLSIGASSIKIAELKKKGKSQWTLVRYASVGISDAFSEQREVVNGAMITQAIQEVLSQSKVKSKDICSSIVGSGVIIKNLTLIVTDMKELNDQVFWEAEQYIPFDISEVVVDYQVIKKTKDNNVEVMLVAVKRDLLDQYVNVIEDAKLQIKIMDVEVFALQNAFEINYPPSDTDAVMLVDVGAMSTKTVICSGGVPFFTKDAPFGGGMVTQEIQRDLKLPTPMDAEALKTSSNLPHEVSEIVARMGHILATELKKSVDFYTASSLGPPVSAVYLSGGGSRATHLSKIIEEYVNLPVVYLNPFEQIIAADPAAMSQDYLDSIAQEAVIPIGLAIRAGDKK